MSTHSVALSRDSSFFICSKANVWVAWDDMSASVLETRPHDERGLTPQLLGGMRSRAGQRPQPLCRRHLSWCPKRTVQTAVGSHQGRGGAMQRNMRHCHRAPRAGAPSGESALYRGPTGATGCNPWSHSRSPGRTPCGWPALHPSPTGADMAMAQILSVHHRGPAAPFPSRLHEGQVSPQLPEASVPWLASGIGKGTSADHTPGMGDTPHAWPGLQGSAPRKHCQLRWAPALLRDGRQRPERSLRPPTCPSTDFLPHLPRPCGQTWVRAPTCLGHSHGTHLLCGALPPGIATKHQPLGTLGAPGQRPRAARP